MSKPNLSTEQFPRKFGKYHLLSHLAQGGMGALYLAVTGDKGFERLLCIKTVLPHLADKEYVARFRDEAKIVVQLSHGNLIPVFDAGQVDGELFLAMDFVKGKDLRAVWNRCAKKAVAFPIDVAVYITKELCRGLGYAHKFGDIDLVHRDVSPPNVLVSYSGEVKLTDFGLASSTLKMEKTVPGIIYGKVAYMSPEQARGESLDGRSDVYAAGIILWELLTGRQLFPPGKEQPQDLLKRAKDPEVMSASKRAPRVPTDLDAIVLKSLCANRDERYTNAEEFRDALGAWLAKNHPQTDANRVEKFVSGLFEEDIVREEDERQALMQSTRERVKTLPPTDELRRLLEEVGADAARKTLVNASDRRQNEVGPNEGRRAVDQGLETRDRRGSGGRGRRLVDTLDQTQPGLAVEVPPPVQGGATVVTDEGGRAATAAQLAYDPDEPPELIGKILSERYSVEKLIGEGGMGRVYLAEHVDIGKKVAIKVLHPVYGRMPDLVERFRREARAASKIGHPNIVDVTDSGTTDDGSVYFVMEYLEGVELASIIDREGAIDIRRSLDISTQVCRALSAAHAVGIIHRDLKPENIFLTSREGNADFVKILDFGIAKSSEVEEARAKKLTSPGMAMGTPEYMAPEQAAGKNADERCDVYALGAILYEMLTGRAPYEGANFMEILTRKATEEPAPPSQFRDEIPPVLEDLVMQAMSRSPDDRPPSMEAMEYELTKCLAGRGTAVANILGISQEEGHDGASLSSEGAEHSSVSPLPRRSSRQQSVAPPPDLPEEDTVDVTAAVPSISGGGFKAMGWFLFVAFLISAGIAILYVAKGEQSEKDLSPEELESASAKEIESSPVSKPRKREKKNRNKSKKTPSEKTSGTKTSSAKKTEKASGKSTSAKSPVKAKTSRSSGPPRNEKEASQLLSEAKSHMAKMQWQEARAKYSRVSSGKYRSQEGHLGLAEVAFNNKQSDLAIKHAKKAGKSIPARMTLGNAYFQQGKYRAALDLYSEVLAKSPKHKAAKRNAKEARKRLGIR